MKYAQIRKMDIVNGIGVACSLFVQGCPHHCYNCFNQDTWDFNGGKEWTNDIENQFIDICIKPYIDCISILGGEPLVYPQELLKLLKRVKLETDKPIFIWTGFVWESLTKEQMECVKYADFLIDGRFVDELKDYRLKLRGSSNQRIIDIQKSLKKKKIITYKY